MAKQIVKGFISNFGKICTTSIIFQVYNRTTNVRKGPSRAKNLASRVKHFIHQNECTKIKREDIRVEDLEVNDFTEVPANSSCETHVSGQTPPSCKENQQKLPVHCDYLVEPIRANGKDTQNLDSNTSDFIVQNYTKPFSWLPRTELDKIEEESFVAEDNSEIEIVKCVEEVPCDEEVPSVEETTDVRESDNDDSVELEKEDKEIKTKEQEARNFEGSLNTDFEKEERVQEIMDAQQHDDEDSNSEASSLFDEFMDKTTRKRIITFKKKINLLEATVDSLKMTNRMIVSINGQNL